ncbi:MAG TPA: NADH-quinone oxidoreductase subunit N, partial [Bacteroidia bacterium]|nr:NADH-quinone oxidoreductase subunit N [Bacteroidia bacterium]
MTEFLFLLKHELILGLILVILLIMKIGSKSMTNSSLISLMNGLLFINFVAGWFLNREGVLFGGMFQNSSLLVFEKNVLSLGTWIICLQSSAWMKNHKHLPEFYMLMISTLMGMFFMLSSGNLLMFYIGLELSTIPLAAMCNFDLEKANSSEAAMKMIMSSAFSSGILLFGISLFYGMTGTFSLGGPSYNFDGSPLQVLAFIMIFSGFAFKLSVVPFHLWTADVYEGSPVAVTSYLSVISKGSMVFVFASVMYTAFRGIASVWYDGLVVLSLVTMIVGNLFALRQNNMKRFLAFSSIAQVGYILIGISGSSESGMASSIYFILIYIFSNLGAFGVISLISAHTGRESVDDYKGMYKTNPMLSWVLAL